MRVGDNVDELGVIVTEQGRRYFRRDAGGRLELELRDIPAVPSKTRVRLVGTCVAPQVVAVRELQAGA